MTTDDQLAFVQAFNRLAVACRLAPGEGDASMQRVYWDALEDLPLADVLAATETLVRSAKWFPKAAEWRESARLAARARVQAGSDRSWDVECGRCDDTGWEERRCYPGTLDICGRPKCRTGVQGEHRDVTRCKCRDTNRTYQRHHRAPEQRSTR